MVGDYFTGGWAQIADGIAVTEFPDTTVRRARKSRYVTSGFVQMLFPDLAGLDSDYFPPTTARKLLDLLTRHGQQLKPLTILTHDHPDPDSLASA